MGPTGPMGIPNIISSLVNIRCNTFSVASKWPRASPNSKNATVKRRRGDVEDARGCRWRPGSARGVERSR